MGRAAPAGAAGDRAYPEFDGGQLLGGLGRAPESALEAVRNVLRRAARPPGFVRAETQRRGEERNRVGALRAAGGVCASLSAPLRLCANPSLPLRGFPSSFAPWGETDLPFF